MQKKAQSSLEFLMILGVALTIILILAGIFVSYSNGAKKNLDQQQLRNIGDEIISNSERVYFLGTGNRVTQKSNFPDGIVNFTIVHMNISNGTGYNQFDLINITFHDSGNVENLIFYPNELYIRLNSTKCYHTPVVNGSWSSYFNVSTFSQGPKQIRIESLGEWVSLSFTQR